jgi:hypothetical protein
MADIPWDKIGDWLKSDQAKKLGKTALTVGAGALERSRAKKGLEAGIAERRAAAEEQAIQGQKEAAEALLASGDRRAQEQRGDIVSALQSGDPRAAAGMLGTLDQIGASEDARRAQALGMKAGAEQQRAALTEKEKDFQSALDQMIMERGAAGADEGRRTLLDLAEREQGAGPAATASGMETATALSTLLKDYEPDNPSGKKYGGRIKAEAGMRYLADEGFKTKGEFNHDTNKKAVIDEENGEKEAELTGGELVFNPDQSEMMEELIKKGDEKGLLEFMKELMSKPQFQD